MAERIIMEENEFKLIIYCDFGDQIEKLDWKI